MATSLTNDLMYELQGQPLHQISQQLGLAPDETANAVSAALPLLMGALGRNASQPEGAQALFGSLDQARLLAMPDDSTAVLALRPRLRFFTN